ncbi:hypothetical protein PT974_06950 [Cladobotryum mycophilum]|uniref:Uncharacterized protein n=1 Tax=Cladobotryum mycophilum TaxID=491253 RepID=A0ABR0SN25_9HYPO
MIPPCPPPPPLLQPIARTRTPPPRPEPPAVASTGPVGAFLVELLTYNGHPFKDHWAYFVRSHASPDIGVKIHATGSVANGFEFEVKRYHNLNDTTDVPTKRIPLQWIDAGYFDQDAMLNFGQAKIDNVPVCGFEASLYKVPAPEKTLNSAATSGRRITQRDCQTWIVESADQLVKDGILSQEVADFLHSYK